MSAKTKSDVVPKSCQENWLELNPDEKSRFCTLCQMNVFDFSDKDSNTTKDVCLRYSTTIENDKKDKSNILHKVSKYLIKKK